MGHTQGPWKAERYEYSRRNSRHQWFVCNSDMRDIVIFDLSGDNQEANARLIAKAPDLLQACRDARGIIIDLLNPDENSRAKADAFVTELSDLIEATDPMYPVAARE